MGVARSTWPTRFCLWPGHGAAVAFVGLITDGPRIEKYKVRGPVLVIIAILSFAGMIRPLGLVVSTFLAFFISILGSTEMRWIDPRFRNRRFFRLSPTPGIAVNSDVKSRNSRRLR